MTKLPPEPVPPKSDEAEFEADPEYAFALKNVNRLFLDRPLAEGSHVEGTFSGRVKGLRKEERQTTYLIETLDAEIVEPRKGK